MSAGARRPGQLALDLGHRPALGGDDFLVAAPNAAAVGWIDAWPDWPAPAVVIVGPAGCGKTHLASVFLARTGGRMIGAGDLARADAAALLDGVPAAAIDDADRVAGDGAEEALLHLLNTAREAGKQVLLTAARPPARWGVGLADLASRLNALPQATIGAPDDALIAAVLVKQFADRQLKVEAGVISFMLTRMERSFAAARGAVAAVDARALAERRAVTVPLVKQVLESQS